VQGFNPKLDGFKRCVAVQLGVIYVTPRRPTGSREGFCENPPFPAALLLAAWESFMTPSQLKNIKIPPKKGGSSYCFIKKSPKTAFFV
jgi:hypothetical protein